MILTITAVSDNTRPALSKTFQDFGFFFDVNKTVIVGTVASISCDMSLCFERRWQTRFGTISKRKIVALRPIGREAKVYTRFVLCLKVFKFFFMIHACTNI